MLRVTMKPALPPFVFALLLLGCGSAVAELRVPASTAYLEPEADGAKVSKDGIAGWKNPQVSVSWFGELKAPGKLDAAVVLRLPKDTVSQLQMFVAMEVPDPPRISAAW